MEVKKALLVATIGYFFPQFEMINISILKNLGYEVHVAADFTVPISEKRWIELKESGVKIHQVDFTRKPLSVYKNFKSYMQLNELIKKEQFELIHCHTPVAGAIARLSAYSCGIEKVIYTAHGFHFYKGGSIKNWLLYYPAEKFLSRFTKVQITINREDYAIAKSKFHSKCVKYVPGVGISIPDNKQNNIIHSLIEKRSFPEIRKIRHTLGVKEDEYMLISVGELIDRKNHSMIIKALSMCKEIPFKYFILGTGKNEKKYQKWISDINMNEKIQLLGYRDDVMELDRAADLFIFPSVQEGLPLALMEAIGENTPVIVSDIRGNRELVHNIDRMFDPKKPKDFIEKLKAALKELNDSCMNDDVMKNKENLKNFSSGVVEKKMREIYRSVE